MSRISQALRIRGIRTVLLVMSFLLTLSASSQGAPFPVTKTADTADGTCDADCSLREAIIAANAAAGADTITLPAGTYNLSIPGTGENIAGPTGTNPAIGDLDITDEVTIIGLSAATTIIDGQAIDRIFHIRGGPVTINNVTVRNGRIQAGGGIFVEAVTTVNFNRMVVTGNNGLTSGGGGIRNTGGTLTIIDSTISNNTANAQGAGIFNSGPLTIDRSTISGNVATGSSGGGIRNENGALTIENSTISNNVAGAGGGILNFNGTTTITASTIADNSAGTGSGGGIANFASTATAVTFSKSILANNTAATGPDCADTITSGGFNLIENTSGCTIGGTTTGNITGQDPQLEPLGLYGNPSGVITETRRLLGTSPALNAVTSGCPPPATDQRDYNRPQQTACEMGSFECRVIKGVPECAGGVAPTATATPTVPGPTSTPTATSTVVPPSATFTPVSGAPAPAVPTLSFPMLALLGLALAGAAVFLIRR